MIQKKNLYALLLILISFSDLLAQNFIGNWEGRLDIQSVKLRLVFQIEEKNGVYQATMDSPDQGTKDTPFYEVLVKNNTIVMKLPSALIEYTGTLNKENQIIGTFTQAGQSFPLDLLRKIIKEKKRKPQEPIKPYPYLEKEITFNNDKEDITLSGTLTLPSNDGIYPAVILITGSGPQNRDEELAGHKPFLILADYLTKLGIAVLRYDDRGVGGSEGVFQDATTLDFTSDVESALTFLKNRNDIDSSQIGLIGHSEGGVIAPLVASKRDDVRFIVMLAGTGITGKEILLSQLEKFNEVSDLTDQEKQIVFKIYSEIYELIQSSQSLDLLKNKLKLYLESKWDYFPNAQKLGMNKEKFISFQINQISTPWLQFFTSHDPTLALAKVKCPVLALNGEKDWQVNYKINLKAIETALTKGGNTQISIKSIPNLNHLFQECETGAISEYGEIEQTFSPLVLNEISEWVLSIISK